MTAAASAGAGPSRAVGLVVRLRDVVWRPTAKSMRLLALAGVVMNAAIMVSGSAVRVTKSGLGCPDWPKCTGDSLTPTAHEEHAALNMAIEFGNRTFTTVVLAVGIAVFVAALRLRPRRRDLVLLAATQPFSVIGQIFMGGITVLTDLHPVSVAMHFLLSIALLAAAVALWVRAGEGDDPPCLVVSAAQRLLAWLLTAVVVAVIVAGTVVTNTGPHAGDDKARRFGFAIETVAKVHAGFVWATVILTVALLAWLWRTGAPFRRVLELLIIVLAQGLIGYVQYFTGVPAVLVSVHVLGAALVWIATVRVAFGLRERGPQAAAVARPAN